MSFPAIAPLTASWYAAELTKKFDSPFYVEHGRKYHRIVDGANRCVHCFIDAETGAVLKAAGWKGPAKGVRFHNAEDALDAADRFGRYLYVR